jgi:hypothetical protein
MKHVWLVVLLALTVAGVGVACGPEEPYCYQEHTSCAQAKLDQEAREQEERERILREMDASASTGDGGATVVD